MVVGATFVALVSFILIGAYGAMMPTQLTVEVHNRTSESQLVNVMVIRDGSVLKSWSLTIAPRAAKSVVYPLDIGHHEVAVSCSPLGSLSVDLDIPFKFLDKECSESFTVTGDGVVRGNVY